MLRASTLTRLARLQPLLSRSAVILSPIRPLSHLAAAVQPARNPATAPQHQRRSLASIVEEANDDPTLPQFIVGTRNGFLPRQDPLPRLPDEFGALESLLERMTVKMADGSPGLLGKGEFGDAVNKELPLYDVDSIRDQRLLTALFRDYTFAASAYLLEPCDIMNRKRGEYGLGRDVLPKNLAVPLVKVSEKIGSKPFMEYAQSYALYNYKRKDASKPVEYENLELIRKFSGMESEHGFILVHVAMVANTGDLVKSTLGVLAAAERNDRAAFDQEMRGMLTTMQKINGVMDTMWKHSETSSYLRFRTFIMGTKNQPMFPNGVLYEGVSEERTFYRGESGANDSIIPTCDNLLQLTAKMPVNPLTDILKDFRSYRPINHNHWLSYIENRAAQLNIRGFACAESNSAVVYLALLDQVREFRGRHWNFTKEYIIKHSRHPVATGGSPITTWLPNQLAVVLNAMVEVGRQIKQDELTPYHRHLCEELTIRGDAQARILDREVKQLKQNFTGQDIKTA
ncbi:hypothetical protein HDU96_002445 [Phlyctochytrium bullatum]|nr:hypothetical protein HDU96_002445 [Phlyctochytrium bullatum]